MIDLSSVPNFVLINELERRVAEGIITVNVSFDYDQDQNLGDLEQAVKKVEEGWDILQQQSEELDRAMEDLQNTRSEVMSNIEKRHAAFREEMERLKKEGIQEEQAMNDSLKKLHSAINDI